METAYQSVANKAGMLMEPQHQLGFEIVSKNETNTRLLGVFAFRTGSELLYAPVFFLNGDIKGTDLLYRHRVKRFLPMDEKIVRRLVSLTKSELGGGVDRSFARRQPQALHVERIAYPPPTYKQASAETKAAFADMLTKVAFPTGVLADFMQNKGGSFALEKLAALMESVPAFGAACEARLTRAMLGIDGSPYPVDVAVETTLRGLSKRASADEQRALRELAYQVAVANDIGNTKLAAAFFGEETLELRPAEAVLFDKSASASKRDEAASRGYDLLDKRRDLKPAIVDEVDRLTTLCRPGIHKVLDEKGDKVEVRAFVRSDRSLYDFMRSGEVCYGTPVSCGSTYDHAHDPDFYCFTTDAKAKMSQMLTGVDTLVAETDSAKEPTDGLYTSEDVEPGKVYMLVDNNEVFTEPFMLVSKATDEQGLVSLAIRRRWDSENETRLLRCNPDTKASVDGVLGAGARFIAIDTDPLPERRKDEPCSSRAFGDTKGFFVVGRKDLTAELRKSACRHAELRHDAGFFSLSIEGQAHGEAKRKQAAVALATRLALPAESAEELLTKAASAFSGTTIRGPVLRHPMCGSI